jgi:predicted hydrocarbon binding protein
MSNNRLSTQAEVRAQNAVVLLRGESFEKMLTDFTETYGNPGYSMIYSMGRKVGQREFKNIVEEQNRLNLPTSHPKILKKVLERFTSMGWGSFKAESLELNVSSIIVVTNNIFSETCSRSSVGCCFIQGIISGLMQEVFESEPIYGEPRCLPQPEGRCVIRLTAGNIKSVITEPTVVVQVDQDNITKQTTPGDS